MIPSKRYDEIIRQCGFETDTAQLASIRLLDNLYLSLTQIEPDHSSWWQKWFDQNRPLNTVKGLYLWGGVGRGKTFLMDIFYQSLPFNDKCRFHFHQFMNQVHHSLKKTENKSNPLDYIASELARKTKIICLDEFVISDIGDAMIMGGLIESLFDQGVVLVTTSNSPPENLYHDGLQRARFLPAINLINQNCQVVNLDAGQDYRLSGLKETHLYNVPHSQSVSEQFQQYLREQITPFQQQAESLQVNGRNLDFQFCAEDIVWFSFHQLCQTNRSQNDYLEIAKLFNSLMLTEIQQMDSMSDDVAKRFVLLIDILYDHHVILMCSAAVAVEQLYIGKRLAFEFDRTVSRLIEMQSKQYLAQAHSQK